MAPDRSRWLKMASSMPPRGVQDGPKELQDVPKEPQEASKTALSCPRPPQKVPSSLRRCPGHPKGRPEGAPRKHNSLIFLRLFYVFGNSAFSQADVCKKAQDSLRRLNTAPRWLQDGLKTAPRWPKMAPRRLQESAKTAKMSPRWPNMA